jgi:hypothetical protein
VVTQCHEEMSRLNSQHFHGICLSMVVPSGRPTILTVLDMKSKRIQSSHNPYAEDGLESCSVRFI